MSNPTIIDTMDEWVWRKVATAVTTGIIHRLNSQVYYYQTYRLTGAAAPAAPTVGTIPSEAVLMFMDGPEKISNSELIDVYVMPANKDDDATDDVGKIRIDL